MKLIASTTIHLMLYEKVLIPAKAGIQGFFNGLKFLDSRFRGNDSFSPFCECLKNNFILAITVISLAGCAHGPENKVQARPLPQNREFRVAVFPVDNLSGVYAPAKEIRKGWIKKLAGLGLNIIDDAALDTTLTKNRIRFIGGVDTVTAKAFKEEAKADAIFITSLEAYSEGNPPKIALISRLVSTGDKPRILWMESVGLAGDDKPGFLGLGLISDYRVLQDMALQRLVDSFTPWYDENVLFCDILREDSKYKPKEYYSASPFAKAEKSSIAVVPFYNETLRRRAGEIAQLHFIRQLKCMANIDAVEPGLIREKMLGIRMIMKEGVSMRDVDVLTYVLDADFVLSGTVLDYQDPQGAGGTPKLDFSALLITKGDRKVVWLSKSYNNGDDGVYWFDMGLEKNANVMAEKMANCVVRRMTENKSPVTAKFPPETSLPQDRVIR